MQCMKNKAQIVKLTKNMTRSFLTIAQRKKAESTTKLTIRKKALQRRQRMFGFETKVMRSAMRKPKKAKKTDRGPRNNWAVWRSSGKNETKSFQKNETVFVDIHSKYDHRSENYSFQIKRKFRNLFVLTYSKWRQGCLRLELPAFQKKSYDNWCREMVSHGWQCL